MTRDAGGGIGWTMTGRGTIGPKAESLRRMAEAGLPVPEARFLGAEAYLEHAGRAGVAALVTGPAPLDPSGVRAAIEAAPVDPALDGLLRDWYDALGGGPLAVRSSGTAEDLPGLSFAGQHGTYFVADVDSVVARVRDCWASLFSDRAVRYREEHGVAHGAATMAVIVQRLVAAKAAGVVFTADPVTGTDDIVVEACLGLGETLVSGRTTPDRFRFAPGGQELRSRTAGDKRVRIVLDASGRAGEMPVPADEAAAFAVDDACAGRIATLALEAAETLGAPADVEWAWDGDRVWLLQARPITASPAKASAAPAMSAPAPTIWSNVNTGEILPDVATPMTWTIIRRHADDIFAGMFGALGVRVDAQQLIGLVGGRVYFNVSMLKDSFAHMPGIDPDVSFGGMHDHIELPPLPPTRGRPSWSALARAALGMPWYAWRHSSKRAVAFAERMRTTTDAVMREIEAGPDAEEAYRIVVALNEQFSRFNESLAFTAVAMGGFGVLGALTKRWLGDANGALANRLVTGRGGVASAEAGHAMWRLSARAREHASVRGPLLVGIGWGDVRERLDASARAGDVPAAEFLLAWDDFMAKHGHHRRGELEFANPTWAERPEYVLGMVRGYLVEESAGDPLAAYAARTQGAEAAADECRRTLGGPLRRALFERALGRGRASARTRENIKSEAVRWLVAIRHALLALGARLADAGVLAHADDIFFVEYGELGQLTGDPGARDWRALVAGRRAEHARLESLSPPPVVVGEWDESSAPWKAMADSRTLTGLTVSAGVARGRARVFLTAETEETLYPGEILVAPFTDPGWTPYFVPAAGIVMDMGGLLSHGSIIAREYGIPAVVNVGPATRIIHTGDLIEVDGERGEVRILG